MSKGIVMYRGKSAYNDKPIVVIATGFKSTSNPKTGHMIQTWILSDTDNPITVLSTGQDATICGDCKHSSVKNGGHGTCYVNVFTAPRAIYMAYKRGKYDKLSESNIHQFDNKLIRLGAYGDPAVVPYEVWAAILSRTSGHTGYTHQWKVCDSRFKKILMASTDTPEETIEARKHGWRTFRVRTADEPLMNKEFICPASQENDYKKTCAECLACDGGYVNKDINGRFKPIRATPAIIVHGRKYKIDRFVNLTKDNSILVSTS